jgi:hypothetical protein
MAVKVPYFQVTQGLNVSELLRADLAFTGKECFISSQNNILFSK